MFDAVRDLIRTNYKLQLETKDLSVRGWNWGKTEFQGNFLNRYVFCKRVFYNILYFFY